MSLLVLDASVAVSWFLPDEHYPRAIAVRERVLESGAWATMFWRLEVANALMMCARRSRYDERRLGEDLAALSLLPVAMDEETWEHAWEDTVELALDHKLTAYDASYLELAQRTGLPLATFDHDLVKAARRIGVEVI